MEHVEESSELSLKTKQENSPDRLVETTENRISFVEKTNEINQVIKAINKQTVHRICSGQVVLTLAVAVKELVENSLDAGATIIEVKLKEYGSELVEVIDNGSGVLKENFAALTLKHYTSKIQEFSDLEYVETLGFRGEALSSLCALCNVTVVTRHSSANVATKIIYDHNGKITSECTAPRSQGTTVSLSNLFCTLPVRRKEFLKNLKREFNKMCQLLYAYCLISTNVKITCINQLSKGSKSTVVSTQGSGSIRDNIINVFGAKQISSLIEVSTVNPIEDVLQEYGVQNQPGNEKPFKFDCFISSVMHGSGRSISDRQYFYINSRPCEPTKIIKLVNDVYRQYNGNQYPFIFLNILTERSTVDVNVTPDKRQIFLQKEKLLLAFLKSSLLEAFKNFPSTYALQNLDITKEEKKNVNPISNNSLKGLKRSINSGETDNVASILEVFRKKPKKEDDCLDVNIIKQIFKENEAENNPKIESNNDKSKEIKNLESAEMIKTKECVNIKDEAENEPNETEIVNTNECAKIEDETKNDVIIKNESSMIECKLTKSETPTKEKLVDTSKFDEKLDTSFKIETNVLDVSLEKIQSRINKREMHNLDNNVAKVLFRAEISPTTNQAAEEELQKQISKDKFKQMEVIGQFNLGFIIAKLDNDLFIIDQHATDEKYNFEQLQAHTTLETQVLVNPKLLNLTAANEHLLIENEDVFKKNGFTFAIDQNAEPTKKVKLTSIPLSKNYVFGKDDIDELLYILQETAQTTCRPSRVRQMFASRACRKSVMIGKALTLSDMRRLIDHMGEIDQPWNCPHGRPTMRHLVNLSLIKMD